MDIIWSVVVDGVGLAHVEDLEQAIDVPRPDRNTWGTGKRAAVAQLSAMKSTEALN